MVARCRSFAFSGIDVIDVDVQVQVSPGLPSFTIVGLGDKAVGESRERVRAALHAMGLALPPSKVTVNLAPADLAKEGSHFDLPIALGLLQALGVLGEDDVAQSVALGELALDGSILPVRGVLPAAVGAMARGYSLICPAENGQEALWAGEVALLAAPHLLALINHFKGTTPLPTPALAARYTAPSYPDMRDIKGQATARRALEIAAAGGHNMLMSGPPGAGKSMLAARLPGILPLLSPEQMLRVSMVHSIAGHLPETGIRTERPFRSPHHNCSMPAMIGGGSRAQPGEISLAHGGILFLDELPEFSRQVLDSLRQPMETREVSIARVQSHVTYPADFQLIAAMNPCRCGYLGDPERSCSKAPRCGQDYQAKLSGPLLDRIDVHIEVPALTPQEVRQAKEGEDSATVAARVEAARTRQAERYTSTDATVNAQAEGPLLEQELAGCDRAAQALLEEAMEKMQLSMRGYHRVLRVARTIADLAACEKMQTDHLAEALSYRLMQYKQA